MLEVNADFQNKVSTAFIELLVIVIAVCGIFIDLVMTLIRHDTQLQFNYFEIYNLKWIRNQSK